MESETAKRPMTVGMKVHINFGIYHKIMYWIDKAGNNEVQGLGKVTLENGVFRVTSAILLPQKVTGGSTEIEANDLGKAMYELRDEPGELKFWWHSHVKMAVFWSGTDTDTIQELGAGGWFVCSVFNQRRESRSCFYQQNPNIFVDGLPTTIGHPVFTANTVGEWNGEFDKNVAEKTFRPHLWSPPDHDDWEKGYDKYCTEQWGEVLVSPWEKNSGNVWVRMKGNTHDKVPLEDIIKDAEKFKEKNKILRAASLDEEEARLRAMFPSWDSLDDAEKLRILETYGGD